MQAIRINYKIEQVIKRGEVEVLKCNSKPSLHPSAGVLLFKICILRIIKNIMDGNKQIALHPFYGKLLV